jgi:pimeloyl-ACP methyl ester carboxylesterase
MGPVIRRLRVAIVAAVVGSVLLAGCSGSGPPTVSSNGGQGPSATPTEEPGVAADLQRFYMQRLTWHSCKDGFQCSHLSVPMDYADPGLRTLSIALIRLPTSDRKTRIGSLVTNPGGPGGSGIQYARTASSAISDAVRKRYDIVGFDPRGVGQSDPIHCLTSAQTDAMYGEDPSPTTPAQIATATSIAQAFATACGAKNGELLRYVGTVNAARDMDVLRAALGDQRLSYLGKSYGTLLGATYANEFPTKVGRMVLDGVLPPQLTADQIDEGQAEGFETATRAFMADCIHRGGCAMGKDLDTAMANLRSLLDGLATNPLPTKDSKRPLTGGWGSLGVAYAMYNKNFWGYLRSALKSAVGGQGQGLMTLADNYADRASNGTYPSNGNDALYAITCLDRPQTGGLAQIEQDDTSFSQAAPTWGGLLAWSYLPCIYWPAPPTGLPTDVSAAGSGPIVVVGTTRDPATPYAWAQSLAGELANGHLITYNGDGHTAYRMGSSCVDTAVDAYLLKGNVPPTGKRC